MDMRQTTEEHGWGILKVEPDQFGVSFWDALFGGRVGAIVIDDFWPAEAAVELCHSLKHHGLRKVIGGSAVPASYSGMSVSDYKQHREEEYLRDVPIAVADRALILGAQEDPLPKVLNLLTVWPRGGEVARADAGSYFAGTIRNLHESPVHYDWAPRDLAGWTIGSVTRQFTWNLFLSEPGSGGEVNIWKMQGGEASGMAAPGAGGPDLSNVARVSIRPKTGRLLLFDTRNFHSIGRVLGEQTCYVAGSFFGSVDTAQPLRFWS